MLQKKIFQSAKEYIQQINKSFCKKDQANYKSQTCDSSADRQIESSNHVLRQLTNASSSHERIFKGEDKVSTSQDSGVMIIDNNSFKCHLDDSSQYRIFKKVESILEAIQLINYNNHVNQVQEQFMSLTRQHIVFEYKGVYPKAISQAGQSLIEDGLFHELWGKILKQFDKQHFDKTSIFSAYYQRYFSQLKENFSNFESTFNSYDSNEQIVLNQINNSQQENKLRKKDDKRQQKSQLKGQINSFQAKIVPSQCQNDTQRPKKKYPIQNQQNSQQYPNCMNNRRLRLIGHISINKKRIQAEMICYFLRIKSCVSLKEIQIKKVFQFYSNNKKELLILEGHFEHYNPILKKKVVDIVPKIAIGVYGYVNFGGLLRIKQRYGDIAAFILEDQTISLPVWLKANGYLNDKRQ